MTELDWRRFPFEARLAIERDRSVLVDQLEPGLSVELDGDELVLSVRDGRTVGRVHRGHLEALDVANVAAYFEARGDAEHAEAVRADPSMVEDDPTVSYVFVQAGQVLIRLHRSCVVPGWPAGDDWRDIEQRG